MQHILVPNEAAAVVVHKAASEGLALVGTLAMVTAGAVVLALAWPALVPGGLVLGGFLLVRPTRPGPR